MIRINYGILALLPILGACGQADKSSNKEAVPAKAPTVATAPQTTGTTPTMAPQKKAGIVADKSAVGAQTETTTKAGMAAEPAKAPAAEPSKDTTPVEPKAAKTMEPAAQLAPMPEPASKINAQSEQGAAAPAVSEPAAPAVSEPAATENPAAPATTPQVSGATETPAATGTVENPPATETPKPVIGQAISTETPAAPATETKSEAPIDQQKMAQQSQSSNIVQQNDKKELPEAPISAQEPVTLKVK